jgi:hypothetical protein
MDNKHHEIYSPNDSKWYLAEIVINIVVDGDMRNVVHKNLMLVQARSATECYEKALIMGQEHVTSYLNPGGKQVRIEFVGLSRLNAIYDRLEDGAELIYEEYVGVSKERILQMVAPKEQLSVFSRSKVLSGPDYRSAEVLAEALKHTR